MNRLIDTMTDVEIYNTVCAVLGRGYRDYEDAVMLRQELENLFKPAPHWSDNLDPDDNQTWVLCFVSDYSSKATRQAKWINRVSEGGYIGGGCEWKYATPVDLNVRFNNGGD